MIDVTLFSREDCHLCEQAKTELEALQDEVPHILTVVDVDSDPQLRRQYGFNVPVVIVGPYHLEAPITKQDLVVTLRAAQQREIEIAEVTASIERKNQQLTTGWSRSDKFSMWIAKHYLAVFNIFIAIYLGMSFVAPVLMKAGVTTPATWIYRVYGAMCHELAFRSWFLFGEQPAYPRTAAGVEGYLTYPEATGLDEDDLWGAREFLGNENIGYKVALCQRDVAIYGGLLLFGLIFAVSGRRIHSLHWAVWLLVGIVPIAVDGLSQLVSQIPFIPLISLRESTPFLRTLTGFLFGFTTGWFGYPLVEASMQDTLKYLDSKRTRLANMASSESNSVNSIKQPPQ